MSRLQNKKIFAFACCLVLFPSMFLSLNVMSLQTESDFTCQKDGDRCYVDNSDVYISATPHTLSSDGYVYLNISSKKYGGDVDFCFGFGDNLAYPKSLELYDPQIELIPHDLDLNPYLDNSDYQVKLEYDSKDEKSNIAHGVSVTFYQKTDVVLENNQTVVDWNWSQVDTKYFDVALLDKNIVYWNTSQTIEWLSLGESFTCDSEQFSFQGMDTWYVTNGNLQKNKEYYLRLWLTVVPVLNNNEPHEFYVCLKPHAETFNQALQNKNLVYLDPWYSDDWYYRKSHTINCASGAGTNYQLKLSLTMVMALILVKIYT
ncbi:MAG: hypothetical protein WC325_06585 [Candidatus Bathyarchaeia archaeon]|jgi:hypothetical protein